MLTKEEKERRDRRAFELRRDIADLELRVAKASYCNDYERFESLADELRGKLDALIKLEQDSLP